jgi:hypothetical protein
MDHPTNFLSILQTVNWIHQRQPVDRRWCRCYLRWGKWHIDPATISHSLQADVIEHSETWSRWQHGPCPCDFSLWYIFLTIWNSLVAPPYRGEEVWVGQWPWELYQR